MKQSLILSSIFLVGMELFSSCTDKFESMNTNPGAVTEASLKYILPYVQEVGAHLDCTPYQRADNLYAQMYCQYFANADAGFASDRYGYNDSWSNEGFWQPYYKTLKHMKVAKQTAENNPEETNICQMIRITQAYNTAGMTDTFGDIPYSEAGLGETKNKYDSHSTNKHKYRNEHRSLQQHSSQLQPYRQWPISPTETDTYTRPSTHHKYTTSN